MPAKPVAAFAGLIDFFPRRDGARIVSLVAQRAGSPIHRRSCTKTKIAAAVDPVNGRRHRKG
ncbi:hypothetical protein WI97_13345 [Burkholderia vietnamiensis]|nr:hypothetical protein WI97_13345 [Burkholderia vietnamiensis]